MKLVYCDFVRYDLANRLDGSVSFQRVLPLTRSRQITYWLSLSSSAVAKKTRSPTIIGDPCPLPGMGAFKNVFVSLHSRGSDWLSIRSHRVAFLATKASRKCRETYSSVRALPRRPNCVNEEASRAVAAIRFPLPYGERRTFDSMMGRLVDFQIFWHLPKFLPLHALMDRYHARN